MRTKVKGLRNVNELSKKSKQGESTESGERNDDGEETRVVCQSGHADAVYIFINILIH